MDVRHEVIRRNAGTGIDDEGRLVGGDLLNRDPGPGGLEREDPAGGHAPDERGPSGHRDHRLKVLELVLQRIRLGVAAVAAAAPVVVQHRKARREQLRELDKALPPSPAERASDHDHRRSVADAVERDFSAVRRLGLLHWVSSVPKRPLLDWTPAGGETHRRLRAGGAVPAFGCQNATGPLSSAYTQRSGIASGPGPAEHSEGVVGADQRRVAVAVAFDERTLERGHVGHSLEPSERWFDETVQVGADRGVSVRARQLAQPVDVAINHLKRLLQRAGPSPPDAIGQLVLPEDEPDDSITLGDPLNAPLTEHEVLAAEA